MYNNSDKALHTQHRNISKLVHVIDGDHGRNFNTSLVASDCSFEAVILWPDGTEWPVPWETALQHDIYEVIGGELRAL